MAVLQARGRAGSDGGLAAIVGRDAVDFKDLDRADS